MHPYIGTIDYSDFFTITMADIPGLVKGAGKNIGLGHRFLRHIERSKMLVYVIDLSGTDPLMDFKNLQNELEEYHPGLTAKPTVIVGNKCDLAESQQNYKNVIASVPYPVVPVSAMEKKNITLLTQVIRQTLTRHDDKISN
jgi:GTP-binding protein